MDRRARSVYGTRELAVQFWSVVRLADARRADRQSRGLEQDRLSLYVRRKRWLLRPHGAAHTATVAHARHFDGRDNERTVCRQPYVSGDSVHPRTVRAWRACSHGRYLPLDQGRVGQLGSVRSHLADSLSRAAFRRIGAEYHRVAPHDYGRPDFGIQLRIAERGPRFAPQHRVL